jgi:hypothetical protein
VYKFIITGDAKDSFSDGGGGRAEHLFINLGLTHSKNIFKNRP